MTEIIQVKTIEEAHRLNAVLQKTEYAALDVETTTDRWYEPGFKLLCVAISPEPGKAYVIAMEHAQRSWDSGFLLLNIALGGKQPTWVMQNGAYDFVALHAFSYVLKRPWEDTILISSLLDVDAPKDLETLGKRWLGITSWKDIDYKHPEEEELDTLLTLCGRDADVTRRVWEAMRPVLA